LRAGDPGSSRPNSAPLELRRSMMRTIYSLFWDMMLEGLEARRVGPARGGKGAPA